MTNEEAIWHLQTYSTTNGSGQTTQAEHEEAKQIAIKALSQQTEDAISRQAVWDVMQELWGTSGELLDRLMALPSVTPKQRTGHWIECEDEVKCFCSECKEISDYPTKFCPNY